MSSKYSLALTLFILFIIIDIIFNTVTTIVADDRDTLLLLFILQDTTIVMSVVVLLITFSSTYVFQAGLIAVLLRRFAVTIIVALGYLILSIVLHFIILRTRFQTFFTPSTPYVTYVPYVIFFALQRLTGIVHYFLYKRAALFLSDPRYHYDTEWLREQVRITQ